MGCSKKLYEEMYELEWEREKIYKDYERELMYEELKKEIEPFLPKSKVYITKQINFVQNLGHVRRNHNRISRKTKRE